MKILVTGIEGFIGKNLAVRLGERSDVEVIPFSRRSSPGDLTAAIAKSDFVFHLAGINRPKDVEEFNSGNSLLTQRLSDEIRSSGRSIPVAYSSSVQAENDNPYGRSKRLAEEALLRLRTDTGSPVCIFRLPNVFGKWSKPNYNSAVATFCHNIARGLPIQINDPKARVGLVYVDDVVSRFIELMNGDYRPEGLFGSVEPLYEATVGELAEQIYAFQNCRTTLVSERVGAGLVRALYSTFVSFLPADAFSYTVPAYGDARGVFVEMLKTPDCGQFSYFTAKPGVTRGGHYHHSKTEKFLVVKGKASFRFRHIITGESHEILTSSEKPEIVETVPGWTHDITNVGNEDMFVMLWANEIFDRSRPDTIAKPIQS